MRLFAFARHQLFGAQRIQPKAGEYQAADAQSDLFALGVTLYQLLTAHLPYGEIEPYQKGAFRRDPKPPSRLRPNVPIWLDHCVLKAVARDKKMRFETAEEMLLALERGASRPLTAPQATPLILRDPTAVWKIGLAASVLFNLMLVVWLLVLVTLVVLVVQDNLVKGAAGQAVQCMNLMFGVPETAGLLTLPLSP